jgi:hypothetical protein
MKFNLFATAALIALGASTPAIAETGKTRAQVKSELAEATRSGEIAAPGDNNTLKLNQQNPKAYPAVPKAPGKTREQRKAELAEAVRTGEILAPGDTANLKLNEVRPRQYPPVAKQAPKSREQVKAELAEAVRTGAIEQPRH